MNLDNSINSPDDFGETRLLCLLQEIVAKLKLLPPSCHWINRKSLHEGPYKVLERGEDLFRLNFGSKPKIVSLNRLKEESVTLGRRAREFQIHLVRR